MQLASEHGEMAYRRLSYKAIEEATARKDGLCLRKAICAWIQQPTRDAVSPPGPRNQRVKVGISLRTLTSHLPDFCSPA